MREQIEKKLIFRKTNLKKKIRRRNVNIVVTLTMVTIVSLKIYLLYNVEKTGHLQEVCRANVINKVNLIKNIW